MTKSSVLQFILLRVKSTALNLHLTPPSASSPRPTSPPAGHIGKRFGPCEFGRRGGAAFSCCCRISCPRKSNSPRLNTVPRGWCSKQHLFMFIWNSFASYNYTVLVGLNIRRKKKIATLDYSFFFI